MSYTVLARRYRSTTFDEVIGQEHVAQTLKKAIASDRIAHAYLFTGTRGVGKTSMARILAKALNCLSSDKPTPEPCGTCDSCQRIAKGEDLDVIELDAASNRGIDHARDIIANAQFQPARSRFKVYIIDEVHGLTKDAFNALLKVVEEPPAHVKFILATTEVEKVLPTILSRCQRYDFRNIPTREIAGHLKDVCKQEKIAADESALLLVAKAGAGSMRDALSLLDRLLSVGEKKLSTDLIEQMLGLPKSQRVFNLAQAIGDGDIKQTLTRATEMINAGQSVDSLIVSLIDHLRNLLILRTCGADSELVEAPGLSLKELSAQADRFDPAALVQDVTILEELRRHVRQSQAGRALLDATLVRMAMADQFASIADVAARLNGSDEGAPPAQKKNGREVVPPPAPRSYAPPAGSRPLTATPGAVFPGPRTQEAAPVDESTAPANSSVSSFAPSVSTVPASSIASASFTDDVSLTANPRASAATSEPATPAGGSVLDNIDFGDDDLPRPGKVWESDGPSLSELVKQGASSSASTLAGKPDEDRPSALTQNGDATELPATSLDPQAAWAGTLDALKNQYGVYGVLSQCSFGGIDDGVAVVRLPASCETFAKMWENNGKKELVRKTLSEMLGSPHGLRLEVDAGTPANPPPGRSPTAPQPRPGGTPPAGDNRGPARPAQPARPMPPPPTPAAKVTPEQIDGLRAQSPLVDALMNQFNAQVVKIENE